MLLARALYKQPAILFLDEATSHLDLERERIVNTAIARLDMTRVIVAHRPDTIAAAGREISLVAGKVASDSGQPPRQASRTRRRAAPLASPAYD